MRSKEPVKLRAVLLCLVLLLGVNLLIVAKLFAVQYLVYNGSVEGTFIALSRLMAKYPGQWAWWPFWGCGMPFETAYLPFSHWIVAAFILLTRMDAGRAFHVVMAAVYAGGALSVYWLGLALSRRWLASFVAALLYSCFSFSNLMVPEIRADSGGLWTLRRLRVLVFWGESPHTVAMALLPIAILCFYYAALSRGVKWKIFAGISAAAVVLSNAFGIAALGLALICLLVVYAARPWWKAPLVVAAIGVVSYCWVSPWLSPTMLHAIRISAPTAGGDYRYYPVTWMALGVIVAGFVLLVAVLRRAGAARHLQFFLAFAYLQCAIVVTWYAWQIALVPQPSRYQLELDLAMPLAVVFGGAAILDRLAMRTARVAAAVVIAALAAQSVYAMRYGSTLIQGARPEDLAEYRVAQWMDHNLAGERAFLGGSASLLYNAVTDNPQVKGSHDQHAVNPFLAIVAFTIYSGMNAGDRDAAYSIFWLKAYGARAVSVPGAQSRDYYKPYTHPGKFDGLLPVLWRDGETTIYQVPGRSASLAHVIPASAVVERTPVHGLDTAPAQAYVDALDDPRYPPAEFNWTSLSEARIHATLGPGQVVAVQVTYAPGWEAWSKGQWQPLRKDGLGLMVIEPDCTGSCEISLRYTGGLERLLTRSLSAGAMLFAALFAIMGFRSSRATA